MQYMKERAAEERKKYPQREEGIKEERGRYDWLERLIKELRERGWGA